MKTSEPQPPAHQGIVRSEQPFFGTEPEQAFFAKERSRPEPFFKPAARPGTPIQAKLTVGATGDRYEQEADRVASQVIDRINTPAISAFPRTSENPQVDQLEGANAASSAINIQQPLHLLSAQPMIQAQFWEYTGLNPEPTDDEYETRSNLNWHPEHVDPKLYTLIAENRLDSSEQTGKKYSVYRRNSEKSGAKEQAITPELSLVSPEALAKVPPPPKQFVYFCNAPFDDYRSGDGTYMNLLVDWLNKNSKGEIAAKRLFDQAKINREGKELQTAQELEGVDYKQGWKQEPQAPEREVKTPEANQTRAEIRRIINENYKRGEENIVAHLMKKKAVYPETQHIFHLQLRYPDSGAMFSADGLKQLKSNGFKIVVTIHEMKLNRGTAEKIQKSLIQINQYAACADEVIFLNQHDKSNAIKLSKAGSLKKYLEDAALRKSEKAKNLENNSGRKGRLEGAAKTLESVNKGIEPDKPSEVNPSGKLEDKVLNIEDLLANHAHVIPGIATVPGTEPIDVEAILAREKNILVFGSIRNITTIETTIALAKELAKKEKNDAVKTKILVVGKIMQGALGAVRLLIKETLKQTPEEEKAFKEQTQKWDQDSSISENKLNDLITAAVKNAYDHKREVWEELSEMNVDEKLKQLGDERDEKLRVMEQENKKIKGIEVKEAKKDFESKESELKVIARIKENLNKETKEKQEAEPKIEKETKEKESKGKQKVKPKNEFVNPMEKYRSMTRENLEAARQQVENEKAQKEMAYELLKQQYDAQEAKKKEIEQPFEDLKAKKEEKDRGYLENIELHFNRLNRK
jgi:hypothetical protein